MFPRFGRRSSNDVFPTPVAPSSKITKFCLRPSSAVAKTFWMIYFAFIFGNFILISLNSCKINLPLSLEILPLSSKLYNSQANAFSSISLCACSNTHCESMLASIVFCSSQAVLLKFYLASNSLFSLNSFRITFLLSFGIERLIKSSVKSSSSI